MKKLLVGIGLFCSFFSSVKAANLSFIDKNLDDFCARIVPTRERSDFVRYYRNMKQAIDVLEKDKQIKQHSLLYSNALRMLSIDHKAWADDINFFLTDLCFLDKTYDTERDGVRLFLERYGIYKEFAVKKGIETAQSSDSRSRYIWQQVKRQVVHATQRVGDWFKSWRSTVIRA